MVTGPLDRLALPQFGIAKNLSLAGVHDQTRSGSEVHAAEGSCPSFLPYPERMVSQHTDYQQTNSQKMIFV